MKQIYSFLAMMIILTSSSCDPDNKDIFNLENVKLKASLNNLNTAISLGDTLKINILIPDTLLSNTANIYVQSLQKGQFYLKFRKVDTLNNTASLLQQPLYWTTKGIISTTNPFDFEFNNDAKPYGVNINFKPIEKGIYYLEVVSQAGQLKINNSYEARLIVDFNVPDKHISLATPYLGSAWTNEAMTREFGIYVFRVN